MFILLYLYQPKCQNKYNLLKPDSVPNYTPQKTEKTNAHNKILSRCFYSLRKFLQSKTNQKKKRCSHKNLFKPGILLAAVSKPEKEESSVTPLPFTLSPQSTMCPQEVSITSWSASLFTRGWEAAWDKLPSNDAVVISYYIIIIYY